MGLLAHPDQALPGRQLADRVVELLPVVLSDSEAGSVSACGYRHVVRSVLLASLTLVLLFSGLVGGVLVGLGCSENVDAGTARGSVCSALGEAGGARWWLLALAPAAIFLAGATTPWGRTRLVLLAIAILLVTAAVDGLLVAVVTSNLFA